MSVRRIFVEKRQGFFDIPAQQLCDDLTETFRLTDLKAVRIINRYDEYGDPLPYGEGYASIDGTEVYWAPITESHRLGMAGRREALSGAQLEVSGLSLSFGPLADGSDFVEIYEKD